MNPAVEVACFENELPWELR